MPTPTPITPAILDTVLGHLAPHFVEAANGDLPTARHAAGRMLAAHDPQTEEELHLATDIVSFGFHALEALSAAAAPDLPLNQKIRLRGNAVSLNRQAHKARRQLDLLKRARLAEPAQPPAPTPPPDEKLPAELIEAAREMIQAAAKPGTFKAWTLSRKQRRAAERIAENGRRNAAAHANQQASHVHAPPPAQPHNQPAHP
jgi:hypothetical protein